MQLLTSVVCVGRKSITDYRSPVLTATMQGGDDDARRDAPYA